MAAPGGSTLAAIALAVVSGIVVADVLTHPEGTLAAGSAANDISVPAYAALLGAVPGYSPTRRTG